ncbi:MAG: hypothetical protein JWP79_1799 [Polaromonas sp.]|nr:hypothetical protein [Polaromonas sp.]
MKHQLSAVVLAHTLAMSMGSTAFAQTSADISQTGQGNAAYAEQVENSGASIAAAIVQSGSNNRAGDPDSGTVSGAAGGIWQKGNHGNTTAEVRQAGNSNLGMVTQEGVTGKYARVTQLGSSNTGAIAQQGGSGGGAALTQTGDEHTASITLRANPRSNPIYNSGVVEVSQFSQGNQAQVVHRGPGKTTVVQAGSYNTAKLDSQASLVRNLAVEQYGRNNTVSANSLGSVRQYGAGNSAMLLGDPNTFRGSSELYGTQGDIVQMGNDNNATINQRGSAGDGVGSIDQLGSSNIASIATGGRYGGRTQIEQRGYANSASIMQGSFQAGNVSISQQGTGHASTVQQRGFGLEQASTLQVGGDNTADIVQEANYDDALISQEGYRNRAVVAQGGYEGYANVARIYQQGNDFQAAIRQDGAGNRAVIRQR